MEQTLGKIRQRDELYDATELHQKGLDASSVADIIKKKSNPKDREERKRKRKRSRKRKRKRKRNRKCVQSPTSNVGDKLDRLLDQLPT